MDRWFILSCISAIVGSLWSLSVKYGLEYFTPKTFACWYSSIMALIIGIVVYVKTKSFKITKWGIGSGIGAGIASILLAMSFGESPNPGFSMAIFRMQAILTAIMSYFVFGAPLSPAKVLGMIVSIAGVIVISTSHANHKKIKHSNDKHDKDKTNAKDPNQEHKSESSFSEYKWIFLALGAGIMMTFKDILTKKGLTDNGPKIMHSLMWSTAAFQVVALFITLFITKGNVKLQEKTILPHYDKTSLFHIVLAGTAFAAYQFMVITACKEAPNVGIVKAIDTLGIVVTAAASYYLFGSNINTDSIIGMFLVVGGVMSMQCEVPFCALPPLKSKFHKDLDKGKIEAAFASLSYGS